MARRVKAGEDRRNPVNTRIRDCLRARLEEAAKLTDRTLSHEIEERLERSFDHQDDILTMFKTSKNASIAIAIASAWNMIETVAGKPWTSDTDSLSIGIDAAMQVLRLVKPDREATSGPPDPHPLSQTLLGQLGALPGTRDEAQAEEDKKMIAAAAAYIAVSMRKKIPTDEALDAMLSAAARFYPSWEPAGGLASYASAPEKDADTKDSRNTNNSK